MTPTSAKIASHMLPIPTAVRRRQRSLTPIANQIFSRTMRRHFLEIRIAVTIRRGSSSIKTISAASIAASDPIAPIAMPISALASTGASLMPSPTKATLSFGDFFEAIISSTFATLSAGSSSACTSSTESFEATWSAAAFASPVSITVFVTPFFLSSRIACAECSLMTSEITI